MIAFSCPTCSTPYAVTADKAGKRTTCPKCGARLTVPRPSRSRRRVLLAVAAVAAAGLGVGYLFRPHPQRDDVERALRDNLPAGYRDLVVRGYDRAEARLRFSVTYHEFGDPVGVRYDVLHFRRVDGRWWVQVDGWQPRADRPAERWVVAFDRDGKLVFKDGEAAVGPVHEERARQIARAVHAVF